MCIRERQGRVLAQRLIGSAAFVSLVLLLLSGCAATASRTAQSKNAHEHELASGRSPDPQSPASPATEPTGNGEQSGAPRSDVDSPLTAFDNFHAIEPGRAYRCAQVRRESLAYLVRTQHIRTVVNLRGDNTGTDWYEAEKRACAELGLKMIDIRTSASALPSPEALLLLYDTIKSAPEPILLHCKSGADRTGMAAAVWRMVHRGENAKTAGNQLTIAYGHFRSVHPEMMQLVDLFVPDRTWIEKEYPRLYDEQIVKKDKRSAAKADD